ncbi:flagellar basal body-associated FliL family protein [Roseicitreum antarcticum]|uniref:Flagellar protein FliL n=1 Tax=Roseicitreum antarcticum TaxID=564137 RepID=A0A1H2USU0_9RHOB|nr:flagellar basal body-associated FliL family protein [Roseicitreum antarcticum]SDW58659.1 flagellar FliL protein [Roseicitreum antarcticum]
MTDATANDAPPKKKSFKAILLALIVAAVLGGGGFYAVYSGMLDTLLHAEPEVVTPALDTDFAFVPVGPVIVSLNRRPQRGHLRFAAHLETPAAAEPDVTAQLPRIVDVLNSYLHTLDANELEEPGALIRLRSQMLRRVQIVAGPEQVRDLLITEFVLN